MSQESSLRVTVEAPQLAHESKLYTRLAPLYDAFFYFMSPHIRSTIRRLNIQPGEKILEVGVGTGLSFSAYPSHCSVLGIDIAAPMLARAQRKIERAQLTHIKVSQMSALDLNINNHTIDRVIAFHVVSVVPDAEKMLKEISRVCKPGGTLHIINYFCGERALSQSVGELIDPVTKRVGWSSTLTRSALFQKSNFIEERAHRISAISPYWEITARNQR